MRSTRRAVLLALAAAWAAGWAQAEEPAPRVIPRAEQPPVLDGQSDDACWASALVLKDFTQIQKPDAPKKAVEARLTCDAGNLYVFVRFEEPEPAKMRAEAKKRNQQVWTDDCAEIWIRGGTNKLDLDQFLSNVLGTQEDVRTRNGQRVERTPAWEVKAAKQEKAWCAEFKIPAAEVGLDAFRRGDRLDLKLGREDYASTPTEYAVWPPQAPYSGPEGLAPVYVEAANCVRNPELKERQGWNSEAKDAELFSNANDGGAAALKIVSPNRYATISQDLKLRPDAAYRLSAEIKASGPMTVRVRARQADQDKNASGKPFDLRAEKSDAYVPYETRFTTGPGGDGLLIVGVNEGSGTGEMFVRNLCVTRVDPPATTGPAIPVKAGAEPLVVKKLLVTDCRAVRGFIGGPVDGTTQSGCWDGSHWEYNQPGAGAGVGYDYRHNDGLHLTFADKLGFNAVVVRGGVKAGLYRDVAQYDDPKSGTFVYQFPGQSTNSRAYFEKPVETDKVSFFDVGDGFISDCSFFRVGGEAPKPAGAYIVAVVKPGDVLEPVSTHLKQRFPKAPVAWFAALTNEPPKALGREWPMGPDRAEHFLAFPLKEELSVSALGFEFDLECKTPGPIPLRLSVQDPLNPRLELHGADYVVDKPGHVRIVCDFPDQILPKDTQIWVTLRSEVPIKVLNLALPVYTTTREAAAPEALAYRLLLLKGFYATMSEARPWNGFYKKDDIEALYKKNGPNAPWTREILETLDQCRMIDKDGKDETVRQYYQWIYRNILRRSPEGTPPFPVVFDKIEGVPEWAVLAHQAWMQAREVPTWWIEHRMTPNGELGGVTGDDTDMAGNYGPFPMFERDGAGGKALDFADRLAEWAEKTTMTEGFNRSTMDPLHAYEEGLNLESQLLWWHYGDPVYYERCMAGTRTLGQVTVVTPKGHRHFRSQDIGFADASMERKTDTDGYAHCLMWHPALVTAWYNRHPQALKLLREWADGWLEHYKECEAGAFPETIEVATETVKTTGKEPFPGLWSMEGSVFTALAGVTGEAKYVQPYLAYLAEGKCTGQMRIHVPELQQMGLLETPADKLPADVFKHGWAAALYLKGDKAPLIEALKADVEELQRYKHMYTTVECFTDRVFLTPIINPSICYTGGYATRNKLNQNFAVSWEGLGTDYAALVLDARPTHLKVLVCNLGQKPLAGSMRVWRLAHGEYTVAFGPDANQDDAADEITRKESRPVAKGDALPVELPAKGVYVLELTQTKALDDLYARADLALSPLDTKAEAGVAKGFVHNIGVKDAEDVVVALLNAEGQEVVREKLGALAAPLDLAPRTLPFALKGVPADPKGWSVVVDPGQAVPEIYKGNNRVFLK